MNEQKRDLAAVAKRTLNRWDGKPEPPAPKAKRRRLVIRVRLADELSSLTARAERTLTGWDHGR